MLLCAALAFSLLALPRLAAWLLILAAVIYLLIFLAIDWRWHLARNEP
jgi:chromate transport protein ChrA